MKVWVEWIKEDYSGFNALGSFQLVEYDGETAVVRRGDKDYQVPVETLFTLQDDGSLVPFGVKRFSGAVKYQKLVNLIKDAELVALDHIAEITPERYQNEPDAFQYSAVRCDDYGWLMREVEALELGEDPWEYEYAKEGLV